MIYAENVSQELMVISKLSIILSQINKNIDWHGGSIYIGISGYSGKLAIDITSKRSGNICKKGKRPFSMTI